MIEVLKQMVEALEWCHGGEPIGTAEAIKAGKKLIAELESQEPVANRYCCHSCFKASGGLMLDRMILCSECGNKRCPKASDHNFSCTGSNEPNQVGSIFTTPPKRAWVGLTDEEKSALWAISRAGLPRYATYASLIEAKLKEKNT